VQILTGAGSEKGCVAGEQVVFIGIHNILFQ
jgi:hypothetical protein